MFNFQGSVQRRGLLTGMEMYSEQSCPQTCGFWGWLERFYSGYINKLQQKKQIATSGCLPARLRQNSTFLTELQSVASFLVSSPLRDVASAAAMFLVLYTLLYLGRFGQGWSRARQYTFTSSHNHWLYFTCSVVKPFFFSFLHWNIDVALLNWIWQRICETNPNKCVYFFTDGFVLLLSLTVPALGFRISFPASVY